jgi:hypothetical protein
MKVLVFSRSIKIAENTMAGKPKSMSQIKQLLLLHQQGKGRKTIA